MAYTLAIVDGSRPNSLELTIWEMSVVRDRMIASNASHTTPPPRATARRLGERCSSGLRGIPAYKLAEPCDWVVRPDEISEALSILAVHQDEQNDPNWKIWVDFLVESGRHGGFVVS